MVAALAASTSAWRCWDDDWCLENERCNLQRPPSLFCEDGPQIHPWGRCFGRENCCTDGFECRGRWIKSCKPIVGTCEPVEAKVCDGKTTCGGITGASCNSRSHVCIDNPDDNCDPAKGGRDCGGCCVFNLCQVTLCGGDSVCQLDAQGEPECVQPPAKTCKANGDCAKDEFCRPAVGGRGFSPCLQERVCAKKGGHGAKCGGEVLPCFEERCQDGLRCQQDGASDAPGTCVEDVVVPTCTPFTEEKPCIAQAGVCYNAGECKCGMYLRAQCLVDPCSVAKCDSGFECRSSNCGGCHHQCVKKEPVICCQAVPTCPSGFEQTEEASCTKQMFESKICVREALCCKEIVCKAAPRECKEDAECPSDEFCKQQVGGNGVSPCLQTSTCVKRLGLGAGCGGRTLPCFRAECQKGLRCHTEGNDLPGTCVEDVVVPPTCTPFTEEKPCIAQEGVCYNAGECKCGMYFKSECKVDPCTTATCGEGFECKASYCGGCHHQCVAVQAKTCKANGDCAKDEFCRPAVGGSGFSPCLQERVCAKKGGRGAKCGGEVLPCFEERCQDGLRCQQDGASDAPGTCVEDVVVPTCTPLTEEKPCIAQEGVCYNAGECKCGMYLRAQCLVDPCSVAKCDSGFECRSSNCGGCHHQCVKKEPVICCQAVPTCPSGFEQTEEASCTKEMFESKICVREALCCKEIVCRTYIK